MDTTAQVDSRQRSYIGIATFVLVAIVGLFFIKWSPYYAKVMHTSVTHATGSSILVNNSGIQAWLSSALTYARDYYLGVWQALTLAFVLGATLQTMIPRRSIEKLFAHGTKGTLAATSLALAGMMCTCCTAPIVVSLRNKRAAPGAALAFFIGNPLLNPAVLFLIAFVISWKFAVLRIVLGIGLLIALAAYANRTTDYSKVQLDAASPAAEDGDVPLTFKSFITRWLRVLWWEIYTIVPAYVAMVLILGALRPWFFHANIAADHGVIPVAILAFIGTLFPIPTAAEVPLVHALIPAGLSSAASAALLLTLPAISLPSLYMVRKTFDARVLAATIGGVMLCGLVGAAIARFF